MIWKKIQSDTCCQ